MVYTQICKRFKSSVFSSSDYQMYWDDISISLCFIGWHPVTFGDKFYVDETYLVYYKNIREQFHSWIYRLLISPMQFNS